MAPLSHSIYKWLILNCVPYLEIKHLNDRITVMEKNQKDMKAEIKSLCHIGLSMMPPSMVRSSSSPSVTPSVPPPLLSSPSLTAIAIIDSSPLPVNDTPSPELNPSVSPLENNDLDFTFPPSEPASSLELSTPNRQPTHHSNSLASSSCNPPIHSLSNRSFHTLPSTDINKSALVPIEDVLQRNSNLKKESCAAKLACRIAREAVFGTEVMKKCTPFGSKSLPALPLTELLEIKMAIFIIVFPQYWGNPLEFEGV